MGKAYLVVQEVDGEVCAVAVCHSDHIFQRVAETVFEDFCATSAASEDKCQISCLCYP